MYIINQKVGSYCPKSFKIGDIDNHEFNCKLPKCINYEICGNTIGTANEFENKKVKSIYNMRFVIKHVLYLVKLNKWRANMIYIYT